MSPSYPCVFYRFLFFLSTYLTFYNTAFKNFTLFDKVEIRIRNSEVVDHEKCEMSALQAYIIEVNGWGQRQDYIFWKDIYKSRVNVVNFKENDCGKP